MEILPSPSQAPTASAICETVVATLRREPLDQMLNHNEAHTEAVLTDYIQYYNEHRPHQSRAQLPRPATNHPTRPPSPTSKRTGYSNDQSSAA
ncbi:integrase core domain-containing protein [Streptomyces sp. bgisy031]|uniref:integrase core domain-containing protein n=1 Tax=Streptomyces sp. bgisy031 TaxID=3413772 RepID=UPI003D75833D